MADQPAAAEAQVLAVLHDEGPGGDGLAHAGAGLGAQPAVARAVSTAVLDRLDGLERPRRLRVLGSGRGALHLDLDGFVVTVSAHDVPMMANAIAAGRAEAPAAVAWDPAAPEPVHRLLATRGTAEREAALADLARLGASTGRAIASGLALAARHLAGVGPYG